jgi:hypothetical protein
MNEKIKKLAVNLSELIPKSDTPQEVYDLLIPVMQKQSDYFNYLGPDNIVKLIIYIYSHNQSNGFNLGDKMISSLGFANLFTTEGKEFNTTCPSCEGYGDVSCRDCDSGNVDCGKCEGSGVIPCEECDGEGCEECDGDYTTCPECDGGGTVECIRCNGNGKEECQNCYGEGDISSDELVYDFYLIATWNQQIRDSCELNMNTDNPVMSEYNFDSLRDEYIVLYYSDDLHEEFRSEVEVNEVYCTFYSDEPTLELTKPMRIFNDSDDIEPYSYIV